MATYFHGNSEIQASADGLQTLLLMNPGSYIHYSDAPPPSHGSTNPVFLNSATATIAGNNTTLTHQTLPHTPPAHTQQFVGIPLSSTATTASQDLNHQHHVSALHHGFVPRMPYNNLWNPIDHNKEARETPRSQQQGLSLSLSSQQNGFGLFQVDRQVGSQAHAPALSSDDMRVSNGSSSSVSGVTNSVLGIQSVFFSSKYLKAAQELLEEVANVNNGMKSELVKKNSENNKKVVGESSNAASADGSNGGDQGSGKRGSELSTTERQEIQMKKATLFNMLDEVEQRYRQYHNQMQIVISSFEQAAGIGSARTYTALALQTISKQFRLLKDAITGQIRAANKSLGEEDSFGAGKIEGSMPTYVDHHLRQQGAIQQFGMIHHNAWRPQRGLPERSVFVLRAWLFEHFLHPYPKDSDKVMLAKQTGLTRSQVSNWFINARVRLWKPMVEEMYLEEMKEQELNGSDSKSNKNNEDPNMKTSGPQEQGPSPTPETEAKGFNSEQDPSKNQNLPTISVSTPSSTSPVAENARNKYGFSFIGSSELDGITKGSPKKPRNHDILQTQDHVSSTNMDVKPNEASREGFSFMGNQSDFIGGFGQYQIGEIGRFDAEQFTTPFPGNNGVSLTLGLPHCETLSGTHPTFLNTNQQINQLGKRLDNMSEQNEFGAINNSNIPHSSAAFESINMQNPKRFVAQLLPDYVT